MTYLHPNKQRIAVLHLASNLDNTPEGREIADLAIRLNRCGWSSGIVSDGGELVREAERTAVSHFTINTDTTSTLARWRMFSRVSAVVKRIRPAILHAHGLDMLDTSIRLAMEHSLPILMDAPEPTAASNLPRLTRLLTKAINASVFFRVPSQYMFDYLQNELNIANDYLYLIPPSVDTVACDASRMTPERVQHLASLWRLPECGTVIITTTPTSNDHGHNVLLDAVAKLKEHDIFVVIIADDRTHTGTRAAIEQLIFSHGLEGRVVMPESCPDWAAAFWLSEMAVAIGSSHRGQALELLVAQAMGRPIIASECGANTEMVSRDETAIVIPPNDVTVLIEAIATIIGLSSERRMEVALLSREFMQRNFTRETFIANITKLYDVLTGAQNRISSGL